MKRKNELINVANSMLERSYSPYSHFAVGAALLGKSGAIYGGCNIENAAYSVTCCAERTALFKAVSEGEQEFEAIVVTSRSHNATSPCGVCRQALSEFCPAEMPVILTHEQGDKLIETTIGELLPGSFSSEDM